MPTANVNLSHQQASFIRKSIDAGRFQNASEVVRAGLHLLSQQDELNRAKLAYLKNAAKHGFDDITRGEFDAIDSTDVAAFVASLRPAAHTRPARVKRSRSSR